MDSFHLLLQFDVHYFGIEKHGSVARGYVNLELLNFEPVDVH